MDKPARPRDVSVWLRQGASDAKPEAGYQQWLADEIALGCAELDAGQGIPAEQVWQELGLE